MDVVGPLSKLWHGLEEATRQCESSSVPIDDLLKAALQRVLLLV